MDTLTNGRAWRLLELAPGQGALLLAALAGLFLVGMAQSEWVTGLVAQAGSQQDLLHEAFHDLRHVVGMACH